jgi:hypothetical protein
MKLVVYSIDYWNNKALHNSFEYKAIEDAQKQLAHNVYELLKRYTPAEDWEENNFDNISPQQMVDCFNEHCLFFDRLEMEIIVSPHEYRIIDWENNKIYIGYILYDVPQNKYTGR